MVRILQVLPTLNVCGGVENYLMNYCLRLDREKIYCDFAVSAVEDDFFVKKIEEIGGNVYCIPIFSLSKLKSNLKKIDELLEKGNYDIIHCHQANAAWFYFKAAKKRGIQCRILHSHQAAAADKLTHKIRNKPLLWLGKKYTTENFACSRLAGDYLYKKKPYVVINNAIDTAKFAFDKGVRKEVRQELGIDESAFVVGHIGRFCNQKNQLFLIDVFSELIKIEPNAKLLLVGGGEQLEECKRRVEEKGLEKSVIFTGVRTDAYRLYQAMDVFAMPSLYEGLPVVGVEAQAAGLPLVVSDRVTKELTILPETKYLSLKAGKERWAQELIQTKGRERGDESEQVRAAGFDIEKESISLAKRYSALKEKTENL
ncbi:MAG: glycosyltransferase family 1 protein [Clostridia bacterium]|nr:glycosyltransferase family 1 protein [Clostridia bacterium]